jgi:chemotaxis protein methyltransferase CheR
MDISSSDYNSFRDILENQSGILLGDNKQYLVSSRLSNFIKENEIASLSALLSEIIRPSGKQLLQKVIDQMTTNETLWFRDNYPFDFMKRQLIPELRRKGRFRIWCAACSSGQEPYSLAMLLAESGNSMAAEILATDLSSRILERAKLGIYQDIELKRGLPEEKLRSHFKACDNSSWKLSEPLRNSVNFSSLNLLKIPYSNGKFDVIFCRNVLIYFSHENKTKVLNGLIDSLNPGGYLFLGASESISRDCKPLELVRCNPGLAYRKPQ